MTLYYDRVHEDVVGDAVADSEEYRKAHREFVRQEEEFQEKYKNQPDMLNDYSAIMDKLMVEELTMGSLFDGIGGFPLAAQLVGIKPVWSCEIEKIPKKITAERFPDMLQFGDIRKLKGAELPPVWMIAGGSPCQDLSIAGERKGLSGDRSGLFMEQIRIVKEMRDADRKRGRTALSVRPRWMCWENVTGAFSSTEGKDFQTVLQEIARVADSSVSILEPPDGKWKFAGEVLGDSFSIAWRVLNAEFFGVAQRRNRVFLTVSPKTLKVRKRERMKKK